MIPEFVTRSEGCEEPGEQGRSAAADLVRRGQRAARGGDRARAARLLRAALIAEPANVEARLWLAAIAEDPQESLRLLTRVLRDHPGEARAAAGLQWACERLNASRPARPASTLLPYPAVELLPEAVPARRARLGRVAVAIVCLLALIGGAFAFAGYSWVRAERPLTALLPDLSMPATQASPTPATTETPWPTAVPPSATPTSMPTPTEEPPAPTPTEIPPTPTPSPEPTSAPQPSPPAEVRDGQWIEVILSEQVCIAWDGETEVRRMIVSTGTAWYPTVTGTYRIYAKLRSQTMRGADYYLPNVPNVMFFYRGFALHGTYWHSNFGTPMSHGCVNLNQEDAAWLFDWARPELAEGDVAVYATAENPGTPVVVHE